MPRKTKPSPHNESSFRGDTPQQEETQQSTNCPFDSAPRHYNTPPAGEVQANVRSTNERKNSMSMIDPTEWELDDSQEPYALKDGTEAILRIIEVQRGQRPDEDWNMYTIRLEVPTEPFSKDITYWLNEPHKRMDSKRLNDAKVRMGQFLDCFNIDRTRPMDPTEDWVGQEGWCILSLTKSAQYGEQNRISKFIRPYTTK